MENRKMSKSQMMKQVGDLLKTVCNMFRFMGVCTDREDFPAQFAVTFYNIFRRIRMAKAVSVAGHIYLNAFAARNQRF